MTALARFGKAHGRVGEALFVSSLDERKLVAVLVEGLSEPGNVAVAENAKSSGDKALTLAVCHRVLVGDVANNCLRHGEADGFS